MDKIVKERTEFYSDALRKCLGKNLSHIILYGSRARGDYNSGSDYDFAVVVKQLNRDVRDSITDTAVEFINRYDDLASNIVFDEYGWDEQKKFPLGINIRREGIDL